MLTFEQLLAFRAIIRAGGFGRAADELFLTQPAVSRRISHLEQALGTNPWHPGVERYFREVGALK